MSEPVSLRTAAKAIGVAPSTLSPLLRSEPMLQAAVVGRGARRGRAMLIDLEVLQKAWARLQAEAGPEPGSDRAQYRAERIRRLWFEVKAEEAKLLQTEALLVDRAGLDARRPALLRAISAAALAWVEEAAVQVPGMAPPDARLRLQELAHAAITAVVERSSMPSPEAPEEPPSIAFPAAPPTLWSLRSELERLRGDQRRLDLLVQRQELVEVEAARAQLFAEGRRLRDAWFAVADRLGIVSRRLNTAEAFRAAAIQELSAAGVVGSVHCPERLDC
ncbi:MAG: hypothetical protein VKP63_05705 [Cyanobacteriota bacterium]|nr:hypothetical protein [Cyanobacteriota bacterium]